MSRRLAVVVFAMAALWAGMPHALGAQAAPLRLLVVDETETIQASLLVQAFASALKATGQFELDAKIEQVKQPFDDPLGPSPAGTTPYDIIVVVPRALELGLLNQVWIASAPLGPDAPPALVAGVKSIKEMISQRAMGLLNPVTVSDDALAGWFASIFEMHGWLNG